MAYGPSTTLTTLHNADGSSTVSLHNYTVTASVNGPIEVQRRDELPEEAALEINIRPASGVHSPREAHLETLVHSTLRSVILVERFPRTLIQVTLQVLAEPEEGRGWKYIPREAGGLMVLPALLQAGLMAVMDAGVPLETGYRSVLVVGVVRPSVPDSASLKEIEERGDRVVDVTFLSPSAEYDLSRMLSLHVFSFATDGKMLFCESGGSFSFETWERAREVAEKACSVARAKGVDPMAVDGGNGGEQDDILKAVTEKVMKENRWRMAS